MNTLCQDPLKPKKYIPGSANLDKASSENPKTMMRQQPACYLRKSVTNQQCTPGIAKGQQKSQCLTEGSIPKITGTSSDITIHLPKKTEDLANNSSPPLPSNNNENNVMAHPNGYLGKYADLLHRFVNGHIRSSDYLQLSALGLMSFKDIITHARPCPPDKLPDDLLEQALQNPANIAQIPETELTEDLCYRALLQNIYSFKYIPEAFKTEAMCIQACRLKSNITV